MIIIVFGLPGSGKSYFAARLAKMINAEYVSSDKVRKEIFKERTYSDQEKRVVYEKMVELMKEAVKVNRNLVLDATFHKKKTRKLFTDEMQDKADTLFIEVRADEKIIRERVEKKRTYSEADFEIYKQIKQQFEPLTRPHLILQSTNENINEMLELAEQHLKIQNDARANQ